MDLTLVKHSGIYCSLKRVYLCLSAVFLQNLRRGLWVIKQRKGSTKASLKFLTGWIGRVHDPGRQTPNDSLHLEMVT